MNIFSNYWHFRLIEAIENYMFNNSLENFYKLGVNGLVRENIQNSLDGRLNTNPIRVNIDIGTIKSKDIPGINEIKKHIFSLKGENNYTKETIEHMKKAVLKEDVPYISFEDCNTKGLSGAEYGEQKYKDCTWRVYAYNKGIHHVESDEGWENIRGGSHGVGKIASNAASDIHLMFFSNCDELGKQYIGGTIELIEHEVEGKKYRSTGYFTDLHDNLFFPFKNEFNSPFKKDSRGLKIIIPYLREKFLNECEIIKSVCDNFFIAILNNQLEVRVNSYEINSSTICNIVKNVDIYSEQNYKDMKKNFTPLYINTYMNGDKSEIEIEDKNGNKYYFNQYFTYDERISKGRVAIIRGIGMKIEDKKIDNYANSSYNAVIIPKSAKEDSYLKSLENESHTSLSSERIKDRNMQRNAEKFIKNITRKFQETISNYINKEVSADGKIDTSEILYSLERSLKKSLQSNIEPVELVSKRENGILTKTKGKTTNKKGGSTTGQKKGEKRNKINQRKSVKPTTLMTGDHPNKKSKYRMKTNSVKRIVLNGKEIVAIDLSEAKFYSGQQICNISVVIVDGMGNEEKERFNLKDSYKRIVDKNSNKYCNFKEEVLEGINIINGKINLEFELSNSFNESLKYIYYVEV